MMQSMGTEGTGPEKFTVTRWCDVCLADVEVPIIVTTEMGERLFRERLADMGAHAHVHEPQFERRE